MATIDDLTTSVSEMADDALFERIRDIRRYRRTSVQKKTKKAKKTTSLSVDSLVSKLSPTDVESLIKLLERS